MKTPTLKSLDGRLSKTSMRRTRDRMAGLFGVDYKATVAPAQQILRTIMERDGIDVQLACRLLCERAYFYGNGVAVPMLIAAAWDLREDVVA